MEVADLRSTYPKLSKDKLKTRYLRAFFEAFPLKNKKGYFALNHLSKTPQKTVSVSTIRFHNDEKLVLIAGMNVIEDRETILRTAEKLKAITSKLGMPFVFKASFDKANRSSIHSFRGPGLQEGLKVLQEVKDKFDLPIITDIHEKEQAAPVAEVADILQLPAFLCRQTDLVEAAAKTGKAINIKKMQMMAPWDMKNVTKKLTEFGCDKILICERGTSFGYNNLIVDPLVFPELRLQGHPIIFDVTHSLQQPGGLGTTTAGRGTYAATLACAAVSTGIAGLFLETHPDPLQARCDGPCATKLEDIEKLLIRVQQFDQLAKS